MRHYWRTRSVVYGCIIALFLIAQLPAFSAVRDRARRLAFGPIELLNHWGSQVKTGFRLLGSINDLSRQNAVLTAKNNQLQAEVAQLQTVKNENLQLQSDLHFSQEHTNFKLLPAAIINYSPINSYQAITIDVGSRNGIKLNQVVVANGYIIGKIKKVSQTTAEVWLLANNNLQTPVLLPSSQTTGILQGDISGLIVNDIPIDTKVAVGDAVVTSALDNLYPAGIAVGVVKQVLSRKQDIFQSVRVSSPVNIATLTSVLIVTAQ